MNIIIEIAQESSKWNKYPELSSIYFKETLGRILSRYTNFAQIKEVELSILLSDDAKIKLLNNEFRGKDKATNVLSFPDVEIDWRRIIEFEVDLEYMYLGDIAFSYETITKEAEFKAINFEEHFKHLLIHAILHLIGYNHMDDEEAEAMEAIEIDVLNSFGIKPPY